MTNKGSKALILIIALALFNLATNWTVMYDIYVFTSSISIDRADDKQEDLLNNDRCQNRINTSMVKSLPSTASNFEAEGNPALSSSIFVQESDCCSSNNSTVSLERTTSSGTMDASSDVTADVAVTLTQLENLARLIDKNTTSASNTMPKGCLSPKTIKPGEHVNIPHPDSRIGPNGERGYVQDPTWLQKRNMSLQISTEESEELCTVPGTGTESPNGISDIIKIRRYIETSRNVRDVKLFCAIYTHSRGKLWTNVIRETWGRKCDGLLFASDHNNNETGHMYLPSNSRHGFSYKGIFQRLRTILAYLYDNFLDDYDFFHIAGDDMYLIVEILKEYLASDEVRKWDKVLNQYLFAGFWVHWGSLSKPGEFDSGGGSGYSISKRALKAFVEGPLQTCHTHVEASPEDLHVSECMRQLISNKFIYTADSSGAHRYHQGPIWNHFWLKVVNSSLMHMRNPLLSIPQHFSEHEYTSISSVAFHKRHRPVEIRQLELLLYKDLEVECAPFRKTNLSQAEDKIRHTTAKNNRNGTSNSTNICSDADGTIDAQFPLGFPQNLTYGRFHDQKGRPFLTQDFWADIVDNKRTFFLRTHDAGFPSVEILRDWIRSRPHAITLVINNQHDKSWPDDLHDTYKYEVILNETNLHAVYAGNARNLMHYPKLKPLPIGLKWQHQSTALFAEEKNSLSAVYSKYLATTSQMVQEFFESNDRQNCTVYFRSMLNSNRRTRNYIRDTPALQTARYAIPEILNKTAKNSMVWNFQKLEQDKYFEHLKKYRFVISPPGNGLDSHSTWEALVAGSIPIVASSAIDPLFEDLPVWLVNSWDEVTDEAVAKMEVVMTNKRYKWEKLFVPFWQDEIYKGLCNLPTKR